MTQRLMLAHAVFLLLCGCPAALETPDSGIPGGDAGDATAALFEPTHVVQVIELPATDWETLRHQTRDLFTRVGVAFEFQNSMAVPIGLLGNGTIQFTNAAIVDGGRVAGQFSGELYSWPFEG